MATTPDEDLEPFRDAARKSVFEDLLADLREVSHELTEVNKTLEQTPSYTELEEATAQVRRYVARRFRTTVAGVAIAVLLSVAMIVELLILVRVQHNVEVASIERAKVNCLAVTTSIGALRDVILITSTGRPSLAENPDLPEDMREVIREAEEESAVRIDRALARLDEARPASCEMVSP